MNRMVNFLALMVFSALFSSAAVAESKGVILKPFTLAQQQKNAQLETVAADVQKRLSAGGFRIIGKYLPYKGTQIFIVTSDELKKVAARTEYGGFGAALRVSVSEVGKEIQVAHNNPTYIGVAYNMKDRLVAVRNKFAAALGYIKDFGGEGVAESDLPEYNYGFGLEGFFGFFELADYKSHAEAIKAVEAGFKKYSKKMSQVYRLDIPGKQQTVYGFSMQVDRETNEYMNDSYVMEVIDHKPLRRAAHLPYEIMVTGKRVIAMHPHYRLAVNFPDMHMFGAHSFGKLMNLPYAYEEYFVQLAGGKWPRDDY